MRTSNETSLHASRETINQPLSTTEVVRLRTLLVQTEHRERAAMEQSKRENTANQVPTIVLAQRILDSRRERSRIFGSGLFSDPAYDILLDMFIRSGRRNGVSMATACAAADAPESTALRYVKLLIEKGYLERAASA